MLNYFIDGERIAIMPEAFTKITKRTMIRQRAAPIAACRGYRNPHSDILFVEF